MLDRVIPFVFGATATPAETEGTEIDGLYGLTTRASVIAASVRFLPMILPYTVSAWATIWSML